MIFIKVLDKSTGLEIGTDVMDLESYTWQLETAKCFEFIAKNRKKYVTGKFLVTSDVEITKLSDDETTIVFKISNCKLLLRNINPEKQFDDAANSQWISYPE